MYRLTQKWDLSLQNFTHKQFLRKIKELCELPCVVSAINPNLTKLWNSIWKLCKKHILNMPFMNQKWDCDRSLENFEYLLCNRSATTASYSNSQLSQKLCFGAGRNIWATWGRSSRSCVHSTPESSCIFTCLCVH